MAPPGPVNKQFSCEEMASFLIRIRERRVQPGRSEEMTPLRGLASFP